MLAFVSAPKGASNAILDRGHPARLWPLMIALLASLAGLSAQAEPVAISPEGVRASAVDIAYDAEARTPSGEIATVSACANSPARLASSAIMSGHSRAGRRPRSKIECEGRFGAETRVSITDLPVYCYRDDAGVAAATVRAPPSDSLKTTPMRRRYHPPCPPYRGAGRPRYRG